MKTLKLAIVVCSLVGLVEMLLPHGMDHSMLGSMLRLDWLQGVQYAAMFLIPLLFAGTALLRPPLQIWQSALCVAAFVMGVVRFHVWRLPLEIVHGASAPMSRVVIGVAIVVGALASIGTLLKPEA